MDADRVVARLMGAAASLDVFREKVHRLRRIVAGDIEAIKGKGPGVNNDDGQDQFRQFHQDYPDILVTEFEEAQSNEILKAVKTLVFQTNYYDPSIEVKDVGEEEAAVTAGYCKNRMREAPFGCNAKHHARLSLFDYATGGLGWGYTPMRGGKPNLRFADTLDVLWDQTAKVIQDSQWSSVTVCLPFSRWLELIPASKLAKYTTAAEKEGKQGWIDRPFEIEFYYDTNGISGNYYLLAKTAHTEWDPEPILKGSNPCYIEILGERIPYLPLEPMFFMTLPSVRLPIGLTEGMLPAQLAVWRADAMTRDIIDRGAGFYEGDKAAVVDSERKKFEQNETGGILWTKGGNAIRIHPSLQVDPTTREYRRDNSMEIIEQSGASPFAMGDRVEGAEYAAQIHAIQGAAGLTAGTISKDNADWWQRNVRKFVAHGKLYDTKPIILPYDDAELVFDASDPIGPYLRPDAEFTVREDSMKYRTQSEEIMEATALLDQSTKVAQWFPKAPLFAFRRYLEAFKELKPDKWLEGSPLLAPPPTSGQQQAAALIQGMGGMAAGPQGQGANPAEAAGQTSI